MRRAISVAVSGPCSSSRLYTAYSSARRGTSARAADSRRRTRWLTTKRSNRREISRPGCATRPSINHGSVINTTNAWYRDPRPMRRRDAAMPTLLFFLGACAPAPMAQASPSPRPSIQIASFERYAGAYRTSEGVTYVVNGHGHLLNLQDSSFRQLYPTSVADRFTIGRAFAVPSPRQADAIFQVAGVRADQLTIKPVSGPTVVAGRLLFKETEVRVRADGAVLAGTITEPLTPGPHPGIVIVHGSGPGPRIDYGIWVGLYASLGLTVLAYDKRGNRASTGTYPGAGASDRNLEIYAADAAAALRFMTSWPGIDPGRVGFHGGSQGGWVVPLAIGRHQAPAAFAILVSGPAVSSEQQQVWAGFSSDSTVAPTVPPSEMDAAVRATTTTAYVTASLLATIRQSMF